MLTNSSPVACEFQSVNSTSLARLVRRPVDAVFGAWGLSPLPAPARGLASLRESRTRMLVISTPVSRLNCSFTRAPMGTSTVTAKAGRRPSGNSTARTNAPSARSDVAVALVEYASRLENPPQPIHEGSMDGGATCVHGPAASGARPGAGASARDPAWHGRSIGTT